MQHPFAQLTKSHLAAFDPALQALLRPAADGSTTVALDLQHTQAIDSVGVAVLWRLNRRLAHQGRTLQLTGASEPVVRALSLYEGTLAPTLPPAAPLTTLQALGDMTWSLGETLRGFVALNIDMVRQTPQFLLGPRGLGGQGVASHMVHMGSHAAGVVALIAFLVGVTVALQSAAQLRQFGAGLFVADLIGVAVTRELGPLMAAILVAGRTGSAIAAELATMKITEELDAMRVMGIHPVAHLVLPRLTALAIAQPVLTMVANAVAILGGLCVAVGYLDLAPMAFIHRLQEAVALKDIYTGLIKSVVFAWLIVLTGAYSGLATEGGPEAVGRSTTRSVVAAIFAIIVADAAASLLFYFGTD